MTHAVRRSFFLCALVACLAVPALAADDSEKIVRIAIRGQLLESPPAMDFGGLLGGTQPLNMFELLQTFKKARTDTNVKAMILDLEHAQLGLAQIQELRRQIERFRAADKDVWCFIEDVGPGAYMLASAATKVVIMPRGGLFLIGLDSAPMYFKGLLDKIHVTADVVHCGAFKSAGEMFNREGPSQEAEENMNKLLDGLYGSIIESIAKSRRLSPEKVSSIFDNGPYSAEEAREAGLVDALDYHEDFIAGVKKRYGPDVKIVGNYGKKHGPEIDFENPFAIFKVFGEMMQGKKEAPENSIAVIYVESFITSGKSEDGFGGRSTGSDTVRKALDDAAKDDKIKAVVLRVDSPGGSAVASEIIAEAAKRVKAKKPFIVSMGGVAASGGYYVSCLSDCIFAEGPTITGSIGVVGMKLITSEMWKSIGINQHEYKRGANGDLMTGLRPWSEDQKARMMKMLNRVYGEFKGRVVEGRGKKLKGEIEHLAGGRVYTGSQALEIGLVDRIGGMSDAIKYAADQANVSKYELVILPRPKTLSDVFAEAMGLKDEDDESAHSKLSVAPALTALPQIQAAFQALQTLDPQGAVQLNHGLRQLEAISRENVQLIGPPLPDLR